MISGSSPEPPSFFKKGGIFCNRSSEKNKNLLPGASPDVIKRRNACRRHKRRNISEAETGVVKYRILSLKVFVKRYGVRGKEKK